MNTKRTFLERALASGMEVGLIGADDVLRHASPEVLAAHLPNDLKAKLLRASLAAEAMTPALVVETLGTVALAANLPPEVVWNCIADVAGRVLETDEGQGKTTTPRGSTDKNPKSSSKTTAAVVTATAVKTPSGEEVVEAPPLPPVNPGPKARAKPNAKVRAKGKSVGDDEPPRLPGVPRAGDDDRASRARTAPIVPNSEFDVDTDVGEDWSVDDDIVDIEEADAVGAVALDDPALDWKADNETLLGGGKDRKRH